MVAKSTLERGRNAFLKVSQSPYFEAPHRGLLTRLVGHALIDAYRWSASIAG